MAEPIDSSADVPENDATSLTRTPRVRRDAGARRSAGRLDRAAKAASSVRTAPRRAAKAAAKPARSLATLAIVAGLVATVALPAYGAWKPSTEAVTLQQVAADGAQSLVVASAAETPDLSRGTYSATTPEEISKKKAEEAAAAAAAERARLSARATTTTSTPRYNIDLNMVAPGSGAVRWPLTGFNQGDGFMSRGGSHQGVDMLTGAGNPIFAAAAGVVRVSQESYGGYGVAVTIDHVINGQSVSTLYGHMTYGSRQVVSGQTVEAGQLIGLVGSTGRSTANHLHFEVRIGGQLVDPIAWLSANAG